jgi:NitT/TauT family transport system substrate-binding protein
METPLNRRNFIQAAGALASLQIASTLTACRGKQHLETKNGLIRVRLQADWYPQPEQGGFFNAVVKGFYKEEGLDVTILPLPAYGSGLPSVAHGDVEFGLISSDKILETVSNGVPLIAIGATMQHDPQGLMMHPDSPVHSFADLEGHTVAAQPGATWFRYVMSKYHLNNVHETPATHSIANFLADPNYIQQIFITSEPYFVTKAGGAYRTLLISSAGYDPYRVFFTRQQFIDDHPEIVGKFVRASIRGWKDYMQDSSAANALILKLNPAQHPDQMQFTFRALKEGNFVTGADNSGADIGRMTAERWATINDQLTSLGIIKSRIDPTTAYTLKFLP